MNDSDPQTIAQIDKLVKATLTWRHSDLTHDLAGVNLLAAGHRLRSNVAVAHSILRSNPRLSPVDALALSDYATTAAKRAGLDPEFFCATILQESAFDPQAISSAGAIGIAQFTLDTADSYGVDALDVHSALDGAAQMLAGYYAAYKDRYPDPYAVALAAYNAGPGAVTAYHGVPPYPETQDYVGYVYERWARILRDESR